MCLPPRCQLLVLRVRVAGSHTCVLLRPLINNALCKGRAICISNHRLDIIGVGRKVSRFWHRCVDKSRSHPGSTCPRGSASLAIHVSNATCTIQNTLLLGLTPTHYHYNLIQRHCTHTVARIHTTTCIQNKRKEMNHNRIITCWVQSQTSIAEPPQCECDCLVACIFANAVGGSALETPRAASLRLWL